MKLSRNTLELLSFVAVLIGFFFMLTALLDNVTFLATRNAVVGVGWLLIALWCQREGK